MRINERQNVQHSFFPLRPSPGTLPVSRFGLGAQTPHYNQHAEAAAVRRSMVRLMWSLHDRSVCRRSLSLTAAAFTCGRLWVRELPLKTSATFLDFLTPSPLVHNKN